MRVASELMTTSMLKAQPGESVRVALEKPREQKPGEASHLYLADEASVLASQVPTEANKGTERRLVRSIG